MKINDVLVEGPVLQAKKPAQQPDEMGRVEPTMDPQAQQTAQMAAMEMHMEHPDLLVNEDGVPTMLEDSQETASDNDSNPYADQYVGRNDPCPCGSGKKYKQCHGRLA